MATRTAWTEAAWQDVLHWQAGERMCAAIGELIRDIKARPSRGHGSPQPLQHALHGWSSRRIAGAHRLVYRIVIHHGSDQRLQIVQCRYHYWSPVPASGRGKGAASS